MLSSRRWRDLYVSAYRADGTHVWTTTLTDYKQFEFELVPPATLRQNVANGEVAHIAQQVVPWSETTVLVQYELRTPNARSMHEAGIESRIFDVQSGKEIARRTDLPYILASAGDYLYAVTTTPFPQINVVTRKQQ